MKSLDVLALGASLALCLGLSAIGLCIYLDSRQDAMPNDYLLSVFLFMPGFLVAFALMVYGMVKE